MDAQLPKYRKYLAEFSVVNAERVEEKAVETVLEAGYNFNEERFVVGESWNHSRK